MGTSKFLVGKSPSKMHDSGVPWLGFPMVFPGSDSTTFSGPRTGRRTQGPPRRGPGAQGAEGFHGHGATPDGSKSGKSYENLDDFLGYPHFRKPPCGKWLAENKCEMEMVTSGTGVTARIHLKDSTRLYPHIVVFSFQRDQVQLFCM